VLLVLINQFALHRYWSQPKDFFNDEVSFPTKLNDLINESKKLNDGQLEHLLAIIKDLKTT